MRDVKTGEGESVLYFIGLLNRMIQRLLCVSGWETLTGLRLLYGPGCHTHKGSPFENKAIIQYSSKIQPEGMITVFVCA